MEVDDPVVLGASVANEVTGFVAVDEKAVVSATEVSRTFVVSAEVNVPDVVRADVNAVVLCAAVVDAGDVKTDTVVDVAGIVLAVAGGAVVRSSSGI